MYRTLVIIVLNLTVSLGLTVRGATDVFAYTTGHANHY